MSENCKIAHHNSKELMVTSSNYLFGPVNRKLKIFSLQRYKVRKVFGINK